MVDIGRARILTDQDLIRDITYTFDANAIAGASFAAGSYGIPIEVLESKGRLLASIAGVSVFAVGTESPEWLEQENAQLQTENYALRQRIWAIEERLANIEATIPKERVVILREVSKEEAEKEVLELFSQGQTLYYSDIAEQLRIDLKMVVEICNELQNRGEIKVVDDTLQRR